VARDDTVDFLTPEWLSALEAAANASDAFRAAATLCSIVIRQRVVAEPADGAGVEYALVVGDGALRTVWGPVAEADVTFVTSARTAEALNRGTTTAQHAFMAGELRLAGDPTKLTAAREALAALDDPFTALRARTRY
jgi:putative sterol carrier protein